MNERHYITRKSLRARYGGISEMTLWRWEHDEKLDFPKPTTINGRKYYNLVEIETWEQKRALASVHAEAVGERASNVDA